MQPNLQDILNAGIGLVLSSDEAARNLISQAQKGFEDLKNKGAADYSDAAIKARQVLSDTLRAAGVQG